jgi:hypothetical protein
MIGPRLGPKQYEQFAGQASEGMSMKWPDINVAPIGICRCPVMHHQSCSMPDKKQV